MKLAIAAADLDAIAAAAAAAYPHECCGLLIGVREDEALSVARTVGAANVADRPERRFEVDPATLIKAHREARAGGESVIGHYHSHPNGDAAPSAHDLARALDADSLDAGALGAGALRESEVWLIVASGPGSGPEMARATGCAGALRAHLFEGGEFREIEIAPR